MAFNVYGPDGLIDGRAPGARPRLNAERQEVLRALVDLARILFEDHGVSVSEQTLGRILRAMGYRKLSARPPASPCPGPGRHLGFKNCLLVRLEAIAQAVGCKPIEIWFADVARDGQKSTVPGAGPNGAHAPQRRKTSALPRPKPSAHLPGQRHRGRPCHAPLHHRSDGLAP